MGEYSASTGWPLREYAGLDGMPLAIVDGRPGQDAVYYLDTDHLDTPRVAIDRQGRQRWSWVAEPFGNSAPVENPLGLGTLVINLRMPGQYFDGESGLIYNWHRSYDAGVGRYTQSDPIGLAGGINTYAYVGGNPISYTDPDGLQAVRPPVRTPSLPYRVEQHNAETEPWRQLQRQFIDDPNAPIVGLPNNEPWCREVCDAPGTCGKQPNGSIPLASGCYRVCTGGPFMDGGYDSYQPRHSMSSRPGRGDMFGLCRILRGK